MKLHENEFEMDENTVHKLVKSQCPQFLKGDLKKFSSSGTENFMFTLGDDKLVRLPRTIDAVVSLEKEAKCLPILGREMTMPIPRVVFEGKPSETYPFPWLVLSKLEGREVFAMNPLDTQMASKKLADFILNLRSISVAGAPKTARGMPLLLRDNAVKKSLPLLSDDYDLKLLEKLWEDSLGAALWSLDPLWLHGDLHEGNILVKEKELSAVLDFGLCGVGDPSCDLMAAWTLLDYESRREFFSLLKADSDSIRKARGWALSMGILGYPYYKNTNPSFAHMVKKVIDEIIKDPLL